MVSTFFGLNIASSGLRAANAALNTTGNNISNVNTDGYSRQKVDTSPSDALRTFTRYGSAGAGVDTLAIERIRDQFYDTRFRENETLLGEYEMKNYFNRNIETYLKDDGTTGFASLFDKMQAGLQTAMKNGASTATKTTYVSEVQAMTEFFNSMYENLQREQAAANDELKIRISRINSMAQELATLNNRINLVEMTGTTANDLRDKRDLVLDELSKIVDVETRETDVMDVNQPDRKTGATRFEVYIAGGQSLVDAGEYKQLLTVARQANESVNQNDVNGLYEVKWVYSNYKEGESDFIGDFDLSNPNIGGELGGIIQMRDGNNGQDFHGYVSDVDRTNRLVTIRTDYDDFKSDDYLHSMDKCTLPAMGQITVDNVRYQYDSWAYREIENADGTKGYEYTFHFTQDVTDARTYDIGLPVPTDEPHHTMGYAQVGADVDYQGIPYYLEQLNEFGRLFAGEVNDILHRGYPSDSEEHGISLLTGNRTNGASPQQYTDEETGTLTHVTTDPANTDIPQYQTYAQMYAGKTYEEAMKAFKEASGYKGVQYLTAGNFAVNSKIVKDSNLLATRLDVTEGVDESRALSELYNMCSTKEIFRGAKSGEFLDKVLSDIALNASNSQTNEDTYSSLKTTIENQRSSVSGVDEDEEAANLVKYQHSYNLASKMIQTLTEIYDRLINQTGV